MNIKLRKRNRIPLIQSHKKGRNWSLPKSSKAKQGRESLKEINRGQWTDGLQEMLYVYQTASKAQLASIWVGMGQRPEARMEQCSVALSSAKHSASPC